MSPKTYKSLFNGCGNETAYSLQKFRNFFCQNFIKIARFILSAPNFKEPVDYLVDNVPTMSFCSTTERAYDPTWTALKVHPTLMSFMEYNNIGTVYVFIDCLKTAANHDGLN